MDMSFLDWPFFDGRHRRLHADLQAWIENRKLSARSNGGSETRTHTDESLRRHVKSLGQAGWLDHAVAADGRALDVRSLCLVRERLAYEDALLEFAFAMQGLGSAPIALFAGQELRRRYLPDIARGDRVAAFALSEDEAGSDPADMTTRAVRREDVFLLDGSKTWISNAGLASQYVVFARTGEAPGAKGISAFLVDADSPGLAVSERIDTISPHPLGRLTFDQCRVPASHLLGELGDGFKVAMTTLDIFRASVGAAALGFARRALDEALRRARQRQIRGRALRDYQMTQAKIADMAVAVDAAALLVYRAAWVKDTQARRVTREAAIAKLYATESAQQVIDQAVQIFGGLGVVSGNPVERLYRDIRALRIYEGTSEVQKLIIAGQTFAHADGTQA